MKKTTDMSGGAGQIPESILLGIYRNIYATRQFELACIEYYRQGLIRGYLHPYIGEEAVAAGVAPPSGPTTTSAARTAAMATASAREPTCG